MPPHAPRTRDRGTATETAGVALLGPLTESVRRLLSTAGALNETAVRRPSLLPGWTRAHVLAHIAGAAESRVRLLAGARTGLPIPQYAGEDERTGQIERDAALPAPALADRLRTATGAALTAIRDHPPGAWGREVTWLGGSRGPAHRVPPSLLCELEIHHVDLDAGYTPGDWPGWYAAWECRRVARDFAGRDPAGRPGARVAATDDDLSFTFREGPLVTGTCRALLAWLTGRSPGTGLTVAPAGPLPEVPRWRG
ncbi:maleylpyruvate isomerase family mycothiol-dependent enzyme [Microbispora sp. ATCC PTA-5024]|uniref:maleylpyruvate isomerase family mycothiol-dependent enzyme n=1 Tax=Microbispora sp. ATCC PTA-5024 TaxID=316330 RepID=UPI00040F7B93|nr:maleylpyruvate isomerase family mycothiol-dependent enzyme [Microbispora sp. ATCC PTA-5024]